MCETVQLAPIWKYAPTEDGGVIVYSRLCVCELYCKDGYFNSEESAIEYILKTSKLSLYKQGWCLGTCKCGATVVVEV